MNKKEEFFNFDKDYFTLTNDYITDRQIERFVNKYETHIKKTEKKDLISLYNKVINNKDDLNELFIKKQLIKHQEYFNDMNGISLDEQQRKVVLTDDSYNVIVASAGSGKTMTIAAKIKYLIEKKHVHPSEILCISLTNASVEGIVAKNSEYNIEVETFHRFCLKLLREVSSQKINIADKRLLEAKINKYFRENIIYNEELQNDIIKFFAFYINPVIIMDDFKNIGEYYQKSRNMDLVTLKGKLDSAINEEQYMSSIQYKMRKNRSTLAGEQVKSEQELIIANYLFINGINYIYEMQYKEDSKYYKPDFYLVDYNIYLEHFGINSDYTAPWLSEIEEKKYLDNIKLKRELHKKNNTKLVETYSYNFDDGQIFNVLDEIFKNNNIIKKPIDENQIRVIITEYDRSLKFDDFKKLLAKFIYHYKSYNTDETYFDQLIEEHYDNDYTSKRNKLFLKIAKDIYVHYENILFLEQKLDFDDMIHKTVMAIDKTNYKVKYKYIIVDEFQDTWRSTIELIKRLIEQSNAKLIVVGDDWQSIYRFAGSDPSIFNKFEHVFGKAKYLKIENTYRNSQELNDVASEFIMKNKLQIPKDIKSKQQLEKPVRITEQNVTEVLINDFTTIIKRINKSNKGKEIFILLRNKKDIVPIIMSRDFKFENNKLIYIKNPKINLVVSTIHASKGLESENVIVLGLNNRLAGFPNKMIDDPILELIKVQQDEYKYADERRLFYVALTRTKNYVYLFVPVNTSSTFIEEIKENKNVHVISTSLKQTTGISCPKCIQGHLVTRDGKNNSTFLGCSNFPKCDASFSKYNMQSILKYQLICPRCGGFLVRRTGYRGDFLGCTNYPYCNHSRDFNFHENFINTNKLTT